MNYALIKYSILNSFPNYLLLIQIRAYHRSRMKNGEMDISLTRNIVSISEIWNNLFFIRVDFYF